MAAPASGGAGTLHVCSTPIGNLGDVTLRALSALRDCALIAAEDTRVTKKLLDRYGIAVPLTSFHEHSSRGKEEAILRRLLGGESVALVTDAGTPGISDPGGPFIRRALALGIPVEVLPGPSALLTALVLSGFAGEAFSFHGFPPKAMEARRKFLAELVLRREALVFFEAPNRVVSLLRCIRQVMGNRSVAVARELTKVHEEVLRGTVEEVLSRMQGASQLRGECTIVVSGSSEVTPQPRPTPESLASALSQMTSRGFRYKEAARLLARSLQWSTTELRRFLGARAEEYGKEAATPAPPDPDTS